MKGESKKKDLDGNTNPLLREAREGGLVLTNRARHPEAREDRRD